MSSEALQADQSTSWPEWHCPEHHEPLAMEQGALQCPRGDSFDIVDDIPRFVRSDEYSAAFGAQWIRYRRTQLDSASGLTVSATRARRCLGEGLWDRLADTQVLEAGCGAGRFTEILLARSASVTSVDMSVAVDANAQNFPRGPRHRIAQADLLEPPFAERSFDIVFCLGVIQHTPRPEATIASLFSLVRPGGWIVFDHYRPSVAWLTRTAPLFREYLKRLRPAKGLQRTEQLVRLFLPLHRTVRHLRPVQTLLSRISPLVTYYHSYPELDDARQEEWALLDTHDSLTDWYKHRRTRGQIVQLLERLGAEEIWCAYGGNGVEARARRPSAAKDE